MADVALIEETAEAGDDESSTFLEPHPGVWNGNNAKKRRELWPSRPNGSPERLRQERVIQLVTCHSSLVVLRT